MKQTFFLSIKKNAHVMDEESSRSFSFATNQKNTNKNGISGEPGAQGFYQLLLHNQSYMSFCHLTKKQGVVFRCKQGSSLQAAEAISLKRHISFISTCQILEAFGMWVSPLHISIFCSSMSVNILGKYTIKLLFPFN